MSQMKLPDHFTPLSSEDHPGFLFHGFCDICGIAESPSGQLLKVKKKD